MIRTRATFCCSRLTSVNSNLNYGRVDLHECRVWLDRGQHEPLASRRCASLRVALAQSLDLAPPASAAAQPDPTGTDPTGGATRAGGGEGARHDSKGLHGPDLPAATRSPPPRLRAAALAAAPRPHLAQGLQYHHCIFWNAVMFALCEKMGMRWPRGASSVSTEPLL